MMQVRRTCGGIALAMTLSAAAVLCGQEVPKTPSNPKAPEKGDSVTVKGCLDGTALQSTETVTTDQTGSLSTPLTYQLKGDKKLLKQHRDEHDGQLVEVVGILKSTLPQDDAIRGKKVGRTKIVIGVGTPSAQRPGADPLSSLPVLEVKSFESNGTRCRR
jgi:hypothetical protein